MRARRLFIGFLAAVSSGFSFAAAAEPIRVAMLPIVVHAAGGETDYLSEGLAGMISSRLEQAGGIRVTRLEGDSRSVPSPTAAIEAARMVGADFVLFGSFTQFGDGASLDIRCARVDADDGESDEEEEEPESRQVFVQSGQLGAIIPRLADLSNRIVHYIRGGTVAADPESVDLAPAGSTSVDDLAGRVEALERAVFESQPVGAEGSVAEAE